jgi:putative colanic acid biosynthesis glycosyltransferase WcaI
MKVLLLNQCFWPDVAATAQHLTDVALGLTERGHQVTVVCADRAYDAPQTRFSRRESWRGIDIIRVPSVQANKKSRLQRGLNFASFLVACAARLLFLRRQDVVIALTSPPLISWLASWFTRLKGGRLISWVMDLNPDEAIAAGWLAQDSFTARALERLLLTSMRRSAAIVVLDRFVKQRLTAKNISADKVLILPPWSLEDVVGYDQEGRERFRRQHGLTDKFVVMYAGNHSPCHPLETLLSVAEKLAHRSDISFSFVGGGSEHSTVERFASSRGLDGIVCLPYQPRHRLGELLSAADLHVVIMGNSFVGIIHPSKIYNVLKVRAPFLYLGPEESHIVDIIDNMNDSSDIYCAKHGETDRIVDHILRALARSSVPRVTVSKHNPTDTLNQMLEIIEGQFLPAAARNYLVEDKTTVTDSL